MGIYDQLLPSSGQYISTYGGVPLEETAALGETLTKNFERGMQGVSAYNVMRNNADVLDVDENFKNEIFDKSYEGLKEYAERGDYENAIPAIMNATTMVSGSKELKSAMAAKTAAGEFMDQLDKRFEAGDIEKWQYDNAMSKMSQYSGIASGDNIGKYTAPPANSVDVRDIMQDAASKVRSETIVGDPEWNEKLGKYGITTTETYNPAELDAAMATAIANPEVQQYLTEMREAYGDEAVSGILDDYRVSVAAAMHNVDPSTSWQTPSKFAGSTPGQGGGGGTGGPGSFNVQPIGKVEGVDYIDLSKNLSVDLNKDDKDADPLIVNNRSFEERAKMAEENKETFGSSWLGQVFMSVDNYLKDLPSDADIEEYEKLANAAQDSNNISQSEWDGMNPQERDNAVIDYVENAGKRQQELHILPTNSAAEIKSGVLPERAAKWSNVEIGEHIAKDLMVHNSSRVIYDLANQEILESGGETDLDKAFNGQKGYSITVKGDADSRNNFALSEKNPSLSSSYVVQLTTPEGTKDYLISKDEGYQVANSDAMSSYVDREGNSTLGRSISNREFDTKVSEIYNEFPAPSYVSNYSDDNGISFTGKRSKNNMDTITISDFQLNGSGVSLKDIADGLGFPGITYDDATGELSGLTDNMLAQIVFAIGLRKRK